MYVTSKFYCHNEEWQHALLSTWPKFSALGYCLYISGTWWRHSTCLHQHQLPPGRTVPTNLLKRFPDPRHWPRASASSSPRPSQKLGTSGQQLTERKPRVEARWRPHDMSQSWRVPSRLTWGERGGTWPLPLGERLPEMTITTWMSS